MPKLNVVTGATGLLGSHIAEKLAARGEPVRALVRPGSDVAFLKQLGVELCEGDLQDPASLRKLAAGADVLYHCAARVGDWGSWSDFRTHVIDATGNVVAACQAEKVGRLLHVSSISVYGHPPPKESITEDEPLGQRVRWLEHYCRAKIAAEEQVRALGSHATIVRPSWIYGPRDRNGLPRLVHALSGRWVKVQGSGDNPLNVVYAGDVAEGAILAANHPDSGGQTYHLCSEGGITQRQFLDALCDGLNLPRIHKHVSPRTAYFGGLFGDFVARVLRWNRPPHVSRYSVALMSRGANYSIARARQQLGWEPRTPPFDGIRLALEWYHARHAAAATSRNR